MTKRPRVAITAGNTSHGGDFFIVRDDYPRSVEQAGGLPVVLVPGAAEDAGEQLGHVDALLLTGGADVEPSLYGEEPHPTVTDTLPRRDAFEIALVREALRRDLPILAICRGHQVLNVATGGTLVQDIPSEISGSGNHDPDVPRWTIAHEVQLQPGSRLRQILGKDQVSVNSFHHQAIKGLGQGLVVSARSTGDGVIEGVEMPGRPFVVGVQWHPESFWDKGGAFTPLFDALVRAGRQ